LNIFLLFLILTLILLVFSKLYRGGRIALVIVFVFELTAHGWIQQQEFSLLDKSSNDLIHHYMKNPSLENGTERMLHTYNVNFGMRAGVQNILGYDPFKLNKMDSFLNTLWPYFFSRPSHRTIFIFIVFVTC
jgi:hypothetical protein